jgi:hypothetical protein
MILLFVMERVLCSDSSSPGAAMKFQPVEPLASLESLTLKSIN